MKFEKHLFISYAHVDNKPTPDDAKGWIARFHEYLNSYLSTNIGADARIWRDDRLRGDDVFSDEIFKQFPQTALLLSVITERYPQSKWCRDEVAEFTKVAAQTGGLVVDNKCRVLKVMLKPLPPDRLEAFPSVLREVLGYEFYYEAEGGRVLPLDPAFGNAEAYRRHIYFLADDIAELIRKLEEKPDTAPEIASSPKSTKPRIYLAECSHDRAEDRDRMKGELRAHGYTVVPEQYMPEFEGDYTAEVTRLLSECQLSIHMMGSVRGKVPDGPNPRSAVQIQQELALLQSKERGLERLIWLPSDTSSAQPDHQAFLDALRGSSEMQHTADLIAGDLEDLKSAARATLQRIENPKAQTEVKSGRPTVYLICVENDLEAAIPLIDHLGEQGFDVELPVFTGDAASVREANDAVLSLCNGTILFFGAGDGVWRKHQLSELARVQGSRRGSPIQASVTYLASPDSTDKRVLRLKKEPFLIDGIAGFQPSLLQAFAQKLA